jgi:hypothetical protein
MNKKNTDYLNICCITKNNNIYYKINDIPKIEYKDVIMLKNINPIILNSTCNEFKIIKKFTNVKTIICDYDKCFEIQNFKISNEIANFQKLSSFSIIDYYTFSSITCKLKNIIFNEKMIYFYPKSNLLNIPNNIKYLNIVNNIDCDYINLPNFIEHLHINIININNYKISNLPIQLKTLTVSISSLSNNDKNNVFTKILLNTKLPFNCQLIIDYF